MPRPARSRITSRAPRKARGDSSPSSSEVAGAVGKTLGSADTMLMASEAVEAAGANLREKVEIFLRKVAV